jgi:hypothetical protein
MRRRLCTIRYSKLSPSLSVSGFVVSSSSSSSSVFSSLVAEYESRRQKKIQSKLFGLFGLTKIRRVVLSQFKFLCS